MSLYPGSIFCIITLLPQATKKKQEKKRRRGRNGNNDEMLLCLRVPGVINENSSRT